MFKWLPAMFASEGTRNNAREERTKANEGVYKEPSKATFDDPVFARKVDEIIDSLSMPVSRRVPDFTLLQPAVLRSSDKFRQMAYKKALTEFMQRYRQGWFSVCIISNVEEAFGVSRLDSYRLKAIHEKLQLIHCMHWREMDVEIIDAIPGLLNEMFRIIEELAYPGMDHEYEGEFTRTDDVEPTRNVYYIEGGDLKSRAS
jgi:hypothetical protein